MFPRSQPFALSSSGDAHAGDFEDISTRTLQSVRVGQSAGKLSSGYGNSFVGFEAGKTNQQGNYNAMMGYQAGAQNASASYATMVGAYAGAQNQRGSEVTFVGYKSGELSRDGSQLVGVGAYALRENVSGNGTVAIGYRSAERTLDGYYNTMIGTESGQDNRSGNFNTMAGYRSGRSAFLGNENTYLGAFSGYSNRRGSGNSFVGYRAGEELQNGDFNVAIGAYSMQYASSGSSNIAIGPFAGATVSQNASENVLIGTQVSSQGSPNRSVVLGALAGSTMSGDGSVLIGYEAGKDVIVGNCNILIGTGATSFSPSNNFGIAIGSFRTQTFTNSLSIGNDVTNQREYSILVGNDVSSDADNSIILGKTNTIESFVVWKDPISVSLKQAVLNDGQTKLGLCNIEYSDTTVSPCNEIYSVAVAKIFASNIVSSLTNPPKGRVGPSTYDLRQYVPEHLIHSGTVITARNMNEYSFSNELTYAPSNSIISSSKDVTTIPISIKFEDVQYQTSSFAYVSFSNTPIESNIAVNVHSLSNISSSIPITCLMHHTTPQPQSMFIASSLSTSAISNMYHEISLPHIDLDITCNLNAGVFLYNTASNQLQYIVESLPQYGALDKAIYTTLSNVKYTPFAESSMTTSDTFTVRPCYFIQDNGEDYGIKSETTSTVQITFSQPSQLITANTAVLSNSVYVVDSNILQRVPYIPASTYVNFMSMPANFVLHTPFRATPFTSTDIDRSILCNIYDYTPELYTSYLGTVDSQFSNVLDLHEKYASNLSIKLNDVIDYSTQLLNEVTSTAEINVVNTISSVAQAILDLEYQPTVLTSNASVFLLSKVDEWLYNYDPGQTIYVPWTHLLTESNQAWYDNYLTSGFFDSWRDTQIASNQYSTNYENVETLSNIVINYHTNVATTSSSFDNNIQDIATDIYPSFNTIFRAYFRERRIFIKYQDLIEGTVYLACNITEQATSPQEIALRVDSVITSIPLQHEASLDNTWSNVTWTHEDGLRIHLPFRSNVASTNIDVSIMNHGYSGYYVLKQATYGKYLNSIYHSRYPWASNDEFLLVLENTDEKTADLPIYIDYDAGYFANALTLIHPTSTLQTITNVSYRVHDTIQESLFASNTIQTYRSTNGIQDIPQTVVQHITTYDPNNGYVNITSNEEITIAITPLSQYGPLVYTCNLQYYDYYYNDSTSTWIESPVTSLTIQSTYNQYVLDLASNIDYNYTLTTITSNFYAYDSNIYVIDRDDYISQYRDIVNNTHIYTTSQTDILRPVNNHEISWDTTLTTTNTISITTQMVSLASNIIFKEGFVPLTKHHFGFTGYDNITFDSLSLSNYMIVRSNVGPVNSCTFSDILNKNIWIKGDVSGDITTSIGSIPVIIAEGNPILENVSPAITYSFTVDYTNPISITNVIEACLIRFSGGFSPLNIHIYNVESGYITRDGSNICTQCPWNNRQELLYMPHPNIYRDTIQIFFSNPTTCTNVFAVPININFTPSAYGQVINMGISSFGIQNRISPKSFFYSYNNLPLSSIQIQIPPQPNISIWKITGATVVTVSLFTIQEVVDGRIFVELKPSVSTQYTVQYDVKSSGTTIISNQSFTFHRLDHISHIPQIVNQYNPSFDISSIGQNILSYSNEIAKPVKQWYTSLNRAFVENTLPNTNIEPSTIELRVYERPRYGFLIHIDMPTNIVARCTLQDILSHKIRYVSYNSSLVQEDMVGVRFVLPNGIMSYTIRLNIKHFYSHFTPYAINTAIISNVGRTITTPKTPVSIDQVSYAWTTSCNTILPNRKSSISKVDTIWTLAPYSSNNLWTIDTYAAYDHLSYAPSSTVTLNVDQADKVSLISLSNLYPSGHEYAIDMYVVTPPKWGTIMSISNYEVRNTFSLDELLQNDIIYQHIGVSQPTSDNFTIAFASSPYSLANNYVDILITINEIPTISVNTNKYIYYDSFAQSNTIHLFAQNTLSFSKPGFVHVLDQSNVFVVDTLGNTIQSFDTNQSNLFGYKVSSNIFDQYPYLSSSFAFTMNSHPQYYINSLHSYEPYRDVFTQRYTSYTNQHTDVQQIVANVNSNQVIAYDVDNTTSIQNALINKIVTMTIEMYPEASYSHPQFDLLLSDHFTFTLYNLSGHMFRFTLYGEQWTLELSNNITHTGYVPSSLTRNAWNTLKVVNFDSKNDFKLSIYWKYQSGEDENLLRNMNVSPIPLETCTRYELLFDVESPLLYIASSNYVKDLENGVRTQFELRNSYLSYRIRNFQINVSTYTIDDNLEYDSDSHNIIIGKDINVQGVNNICMGNRFITSGNQSIIVGNNIGGGIGQLITSVNDIFQSIILGNQSFRNSIVRDIICIGNDNFNNLSEEDAQKTRLFFAQKPIVIGNNVDASKIDYNINIGNVFLNTTIPSKQIYLGQDGQCVAIGYTSNEALSSSRNKLYVAGSTHTDTIVTNQYLRSVISTNPTPPYVVMHDVDENDLATITTTTLNRMVCGVSKESYARADGRYDVLVTTRGKTRVWCKSAVQPGDLLVSDDFGCVVSRGLDTTMHSFTFAKSLSSWDPNNMGAYPFITTSNIAGYGDIALIACIVMI